MVIWITGLPGAGKTTLAHILHKKLKDKLNNIILLDGDVLRTVFSNFNYDHKSRLELGMTYARLSHMLSQQGFIVICATVSMFHKVREWNADNNSSYVEVYIRASEKVLRQRNQKELYSKASSGNAKYVHGFDIKIEEPTAPSIIIDNNGVEEPDSLVELIISELNL
ncbi:adenylyl-sulfate kinase [Pseudoalteromonas piscicida]|uniref:adenylyl-sulfate kinase n=1 Tax=Pseudoalteromonas piscicida TaxID=43662 RepID=UPI0030A61DFA